MDFKFYKDKKIAVTGHTGFKGAWLCRVLEAFGAEVFGFALEPDKKSLFKLGNTENSVKSTFGDINEREAIVSFVEESNPELIFHMAAQPLVRVSFANPLDTLNTNIIGTANLLEAAKNKKSVLAVLNVTTDKCYENQEWDWPYRETDPLGGYDPYSASKAASEIITSSYYRSFYRSSGKGLASARAGNVVGGGDFSIDRIIPDIIRSVEADRPVVLRSPNSVRPWQHVFDVLNGYLILMNKLAHNPEKYSASFNFSPQDITPITVEDITKLFISVLGKGDYVIDENLADLHEAKILKLDASRANAQLGWNNKLNNLESLTETAAWYGEYLRAGDIENTCRVSVNEFFELKD